MFKKFMAVLLTLICACCLNAYASQSDAYKLSLIDDKITEYTEEKDLGVTLFWIGIGAELLSFAFIPTTTGVSNGQIQQSGNSTIYSLLLLGGGIVGIYGGWEWYDGAAGIRMWESKRLDVSLSVLSPISLADKNITEIGLTARF